MVIAATGNQLHVSHDIGGVIGTSISALFLLVIGFDNLLVLTGIWAAFSRERPPHAYLVHTPPAQRMRNHARG
nr:hypothetical protein [Mesorhizobium sp. M1A.F.Ca.ET.072.01.1.1]